MTVLLVVGADAEPSVAADRLIELIGWIHRHQPEAEVHVLLLRGGPLIHRFHALAPTTVVHWYDRRADQRGGASVLRGVRRRRLLASAIDRWATATLPGRLPVVPAEVVLLSGWEALGAGPLGAKRQVPRVALLAAGDGPSAAPAGAAPPVGRDRRASQARRGAAAVLDETVSASAIWTAIEAAAAP